MTLLDQNPSSSISIQELDKKIPALPIEAIYKVLEASEKGLSHDQVKERLAIIGPNCIEKSSRESLLRSFFSNFTHLMALLLWAGGILAFIASMPQLGIAIWTVNLVNGAFSFWQEYKAEKATEALLELLPVSAHVIRDGQEETVSAETLVPGDLLILSEGDHISADARILTAFSLSVDESTLTGESRPIHKAAEAAENSHDTNLVFAGTNVVSGRATCIVYDTGPRTRFGKIAQLTQTVLNQPSPLQREMERVTRTVSLLAVSIGAGFFALSILFGRIGLMESFIFAMGMIVAFVPEGMLPTVSLSLALGVQRMAKQNALIKRLSSVETLGCTTVICTDKTGTITQNKMTVEKIWSTEGIFRLTGSGYSPYGEVIPADRDSDNHRSRRLLERILTAASRCNNARLKPPDASSSQWGIIGDPTEAALLVAARKGGVTKDGQEEQAHRICEIAFDSHRQRMGIVYDIYGTRTFYLKGAPTKVLERCKYSLAGDERIALDESKIQNILNANDELARDGMRILAVAERELTQDIGKLVPKVLERDLTFLGLVAMTDPPHEGVSKAVEQCHEAGIKIVMITGDYSLTAESIAKSVGITKERSRVITGTELSSLDDIELKSALSDTAIFARVFPEQKLRIVSALQEIGHIVAVTGDGVNDAPALRKADIGIAMGLAGTDVAKESADMILLDDNFVSIVSAIELGRAVYANIRKFAVYVFTSNMAEAVPFIATLFSRGMIPLPLTIMQVLAVDLGTDMLPAVALGAEPAEHGIMKLPPRNRDEPLLNKNVLFRALLWYGMIEAAAGLSCYFYLNWLNGWPGQALAQTGTNPYRMATTMTLVGIVMAQIGTVLCLRRDRQSIFGRDFLSNPLILIAIGSELLILILLVYVPVLNKVFNTIPIGPREWSFALIWIPLVILMDEIRKRASRDRKESKLSL